MTFDSLVKELQFQELIEELKPVMNPDTSYGDYPDLGAFEKESNM